MTCPIGWAVNGNLKVAYEVKIILDGNGREGVIIFTIFTALLNSLMVHNKPKPAVGHVIYKNYYSR